MPRSRLLLGACAQCAFPVLRILSNFVYRRTSIAYRFVMGLLTEQFELIALLAALILLGLTTLLAVSDVASRKRPFYA